MRIHHKLLMLVGAAMAGVAVSAAGPGPGSDVEANRKLLRETAQSAPEVFARWKNQFERFRRMPAAQQAKLRRLDQQLHEDPEPRQSRLRRVLNEFAAWVSHLPESEQRRVLAAPTTDERLRIIRELRDKEWLAQLPAARQAELASATDGQKREKIAAWRKEETKRLQDWSEVRRHWQEFGTDRPMGILGQEEFRRELQTYLEEKLYPMLSPQEKRALSKAFEDAGPKRIMPNLRMIVDLADKHPVLALDRHPKYASFDSLPPEYKDAFSKLPPQVQREARSTLPYGQWPAFAIAVTELLRQNKLAPARQLGPSTPAEFPSGVQKLIEEWKRRPMNQKRLQEAEGKWPEYPRLLHDLARENKTSLPEMSLPGDAQFWMRVRTMRPGI